MREIDRNFPRHAGCLHPSRRRTSIARVNRSPRSLSHSNLVTGDTKLGLYHDFGEESAGAVVTDIYIHRITGPAYALGQIFMAGPLWILRSVTLLKSLIPYSSSLESKLEQTLIELRAAKKWQGLEEYPASRREILYLAQMGFLDFSGHKGRPRFKAV